ncbi:uncharacterized protein LOC120418795 [Culex pipiens pallens]|uniref:uncharacterized protein LOC120418795 n=1 Tax=Culex pipiens pallens TaxID=42434 RepID=UPI0019549966|nr:uncharacterized protein LOC120418795 [Culex pipiens pallens]
MEIRWCWAAFILLTVVTHNPASSTEDSRQRTASASADDSTLEKRDRDWDSLKSSTNLPKSSSIESNYNLDEIIANRETVAASSVKKYLKKESKKHRKKYVSNDDYRTMPESEAIPEHREESPESGGSKADSEKPHSRKKRLIWVTDDGRLALPPGTSLTIAPTIALPFVRYPPTGFLSNISISLPVTIDFDKLGLTDNQNPLGVLPPLFARSMGRAAGSILADYVSDYMRIRRRRKRSATASTTSSTQGNANFKIITSSLDDGAEQDSTKLPDLPEEHKHAFHGGERALLYSVVEDFIANFGVDGRACMLRAICEVHSKPMEKFGLVGEILKLFFTASLSPYSEHLDEYVSAEQIGKGTAGPGECFPYYKDCPKSLFRVANNFQKQHHYTEADPTVEDSEGLYDEIYENSIDDLERKIRSAKASQGHGSSSSVDSKEDTVVQLDGNISKLVM